MCVVIACEAVMIPGGGGASPRGEQTDESTVAVVRCGFPGRWDTSQFTVNTWGITTPPRSPTVSPSSFPRWDYYYYTLSESPLLPLSQRSPEVLNEINK